MPCVSKEQKETAMVLTVDLDCEQCYKKVKRVLCKFPQIRNQVYDKKNNTVTITVLCCSPEKIRDKLCCKAGKSIKSIEVKQQSKPKNPKEPASELNPPEEGSKSGPKNGFKKGEPAQPAPPPAPKPPAPVCCAPCYQGRPRPPCYHSGPHGPPCYPYGYYSRPCPPPYYGNRCPCPPPYCNRCPCPPPYCGNRCDYFSGENPSSCSIM